jgi:hypothetical protein
MGRDCEHIEVDRVHQFDEAKKRRANRPSTLHGGYRNVVVDGILGEEAHELIYVLPTPGVAEVPNDLLRARVYLALLAFDAKACLNRL